MYEVHTVNHDNSNNAVDKNELVVEEKRERCRKYFDEILNGMPNKVFDQFKKNWPDVKEWKKFDDDILGE